MNKRGAFGRIVSSLVCAFFALLLGTAWAQSKNAQKTDAEVKQEVIAASIAAYSGSCPCPYNTDRRGRRCGGRSAYSRPGGASPLCYPDDVTKKMVDDYRRRSKSRSSTQEETMLGRPVMVGGCHD